MFAWQSQNNGKVDFEIVKDCNYLGIYCSRSGSFKTCKKIHQSEKARYAMYEDIKKERKPKKSLKISKGWS